MKEEGRLRRVQKREEEKREGRRKEGNGHHRCGEEGREETATIDVSVEFPLEMWHCRSK